MTAQHEEHDRKCMTMNKNEERSRDIFADNWVFRFEVTGGPTAQTMSQGLEIKTVV